MLAWSDCVTPGIGTTTLLGGVEAQPRAKIVAATRNGRFRARVDLDRNGETEHMEVA